MKKKSEKASKFLVYIVIAEKLIDLVKKIISLF